ncbi:hypothetical protein FLONG3_5441 [Fusarium longipes]|uniref:Class II aldolase/adducin N-terminal domain-containing protein n=1 Tax=Fusarium longipes TaxID=694270 RepID=A0A395SU78_9HYPO|nr:hypothetical protein FLONG3_5441 [Fusarium longipes]
MTPSATTAAPTGQSILNTAKTQDGSVKRIHKIPEFATKEATRQWQLEQMAGAFRVFAKLGYADGSSGHISLRDPVDPDTFWINPYGVHFGLLTVSDMVHIDDNGNRIGGAEKPVNTAGFIIHAAIHKRRPDINAACHLHSPYGRAWSTFGKPIEMINQDSCMFYDDLAVYTNFGGVVFAREEGSRLADALGATKKNIILQNHGLLTSGGTIGEAAAFFIALERACQAQLLVEAAVTPNGSQLKKTLVSDEEAQYTKDNTGSPEAMYMQFEPEYQMLLKESRVSQGLNTSWNGVREVTELPVHCYGYGYDQDGYEQSEDCLYLNVIRPANLKATAGLPVAVWFHGGGLTMGGASDTRYNLSFIVEQSVTLGKPLIGIGLNYRLSAFGFITGKEVLKEGASNLGFRDQRLALHWIKENIKAFGGDPGQVTIFGESSGAESVAAQVFAYNGRDDGLFRGAIGQSGFGAPLGRYPGGFNATQGMQATYDRLVGKVPSCSSLVGSDKSLPCLRKAPFDEINNAILATTTGLEWAPVLDGDFFADYYTNQLEKGNFAKVPILIGANTDEGTSFGRNRRPDGGNIDTDEDMRDAIGTIIPPQVEETTGNSVDELTDELMEIYPNDQRVGIPSLESWPHIIKPGDSYAELLGVQYRRSTALFGDFIMHYQRRRMNKAWAKNGIPNYAYRFNIVPNEQAVYAGVTHFQEVAFVLYNINGYGYSRNPFGGQGSYPGDAKTMAKTISTAWINFFNTLDPNGKAGKDLFGGKEWPTYDLSGGPDGKGIVFNINGSAVEVDNWRSDGLEWMAKHALDVFGN